jgi:hypothetical protein
VRNFWRFLVFWFDVALRTLALVPQAFKRLDLLYGVVPIVLGAGAGLYLNLISWWMVFVALLVFGLMWAVYEKWKGANDRKEELEEKLAEQQKRIAVKDLLGDAQEEGEGLKQGRKYTFTAEVSDEYQAIYDEEVRVWINRTYNLINDALGKAEAQRFISNQGYTEIELLGYEPPPYVYLSSTQRKYLIPPRLRRLHELTARLHDLDVNPDFDPQDWTNR